MKDLWILNVVLCLSLGFVGMGFAIGPAKGLEGPSVWQGKDFIETQTMPWNELNGPYSKLVPGADGGWRLDPALGKSSRNKKANWPPK